MISGTVCCINCYSMYCFNFPDIHWIDGGAQLQPNPAYGHEIQDIINDYSLEA